MTGPRRLLRLKGLAVWAAHVGLDRALGVGRKYDTGVRHPHLGAPPVGPDALDR